MYQQTNSRSNYRSSTGSSYAGNRRSGFRKPYTNPGLRIPVGRFINRASTQVSEEVYQAKHTFSDFQIDDRLKRNIISKGFVTPTPIQDQTIPFILENKDMIGLANTGTGKTAAFLIPLINKVLKNRAEKILVIVPTRELALQIQEDLTSFTESLSIRSAFCIGGSHIGRQIRNIKSNPSFVIGTPGRLKDLIERRALQLNGFRNVVLDEADRMLDMGFINDIKEILSLLSVPRQTLLFSATLSPEIERLTKQFQNDPIKVSVKTRDTSATVDQDIVKFTNENGKIDLLHDLLAKPEFSKVLIFGQTKHGVEKLSKELNNRGFKAASIHGNKSQAARQAALKNFKNDHIKILVATDVAARGLDIPLVSHVINFDVPATYEEYVHRIGRTGRAGNVGKALTFVR